MGLAKERQLLQPFWPLDGVGTCKFCGNQDWFDEKGLFVHAPECPWMRARALLAKTTTGEENTASL